MSLEALREPLETGRVHISRSAHQAEFPARCQLVVAINPCPCGHLDNPSKACRCSPDQVTRYQNRLSDPLLDRIDLTVEVPVLPTAVLSAAADGEPSDVVAARVAEARARDRVVARPGCSNGLLTVGRLDEHLAMTPEAESLLHRTSARLAWSARSFHRLLRIARSVAELAGSDVILGTHVSKAIQWRRALRGREE